MTVSGQSPAAVDECVHGGVLLDRGTSVAFRHELARQAILDSMPPAHRVDLHRRVLAQLTTRRQHGPSPVGAARRRLRGRRRRGRARTPGRRTGCPPGFSSRGRRAPPDGAAITATRWTQRTGPTCLGRLSYECYLTASSPRRWTCGGPPSHCTRRPGCARLGVGQRWLSRLSWFLGRPRAERYALAAVGTLEPLGAGADLAMAYSNLSQLRMLAAPRRRRSPGAGGHSTRPAQRATARSNRTR